MSRVLKPALAEPRRERRFCQHLGRSVQGLTEHRKTVLELLQTYWVVLLVVGLLVLLILFVVLADHWGTMHTADRFRFQFSRPL